MPARQDAIKNATEMTYVILKTAGQATEMIEVHPGQYLATTRDVEIFKGKANRAQAITRASDLGLQVKLEDLTPLDEVRV
jgi:hypothetical protein